MKVLVLNSGGFDSVVLIHELVLEHGYEVVSVFFNYGQRNYEIEAEKARKVAEKFHIEHLEIPIDISWVKNDLMFNKDSQEIEGDQYIPSRNLMFISSAVSIAETKGIKDIYVAFIQANEGSYFPDCSPEFVNNMNRLLSPIEITLHAPYIEFGKLGLIANARCYGVERNEVITCNTPINGKGCGECYDCKLVDYIFNYVEAYKIDDLYVNNDYEVTEEVVQALINTPITKAKLCFTNKCNFSCKHCLFGNTKVYPVKGKVLEGEEWHRVIDTLVTQGIRHIDFFGKEPLIDDKVFGYIDYLKTTYPNITYSMITNGKNVAKYINEIATHLTEIVLSVESLNDVKYRDANVRNNIELLIKAGVKVNISLDLFDHNYEEVPKIIYELYSLGVRSIFTKPIVPVGQTYTITERIKCTSNRTILDTIDLLANLEGYEDLQLDFLILNGLRVQLMQYEEFQDIVEEYEYMRTGYYGRLNLQLEYMCDRFRDNIFIMPDGEVLGCGYEVSNKDYMLASAGNLTKEPLDQIIAKGKTKSGKYLKNTKKQGCYHSPKFFF